MAYRLAIPLAVLEQSDSEELLNHYSLTLTPRAFIFR